MYTTNSLYLLLSTLIVHSKYLFSQAQSEKFEVAFQWNYINFTWPSFEDKVIAKYEPTDYVIAGIKIYNNKIYLALPRIKPDSRITLASIDVDAVKENPLLTPFPNWSMNVGKNCSSIHDVLSMEIDNNGIMWVLDARRTEKFIKCPPKIVLFDLNRNGELISSFNVPDNLCPHHNGCFLNDIVVDGDFAYISDTTKSDPGLFVYNRKEQKAWKFRDHTMFGDPTATNFVAQGENFTGLSHINGITLSPNCETNRRIFYMPQTSLHIYSICTSIAKNEEFATRNVSEYITDHGTKQGQSGGMMCDNKGEIYYGILPLDAVGKWNTSKALQTAVIVEENHDIIKWPDSFAFNNKGDLYLITNSILFFSRNTIDINKINFRIIKLHTGSASYQQCFKQEQ